MPHTTSVVAASLFVPITRLDPKKKEKKKKGGGGGGGGREGGGREGEKNRRKKGGKVKEYCVGRNRTPCVVWGWEIIRVRRVGWLSVFNAQPTGTVIPRR